MNSIINNILLHVEFMNSGIYRFVDNDDRVFAILPVDSRSIVVWSCHRSRRRRRRGGEQWQGGAGASRVDIVIVLSVRHKSTACNCNDRLRAQADDGGHLLLMIIKY